MANCRWVFVAVAFFVCTQANAVVVTRGVAVLQPEGSNSVAGSFVFEQSSTSVTVTGTLSGINSNAAVILYDYGIVLGAGTIGLNLGGVFNSGGIAGSLGNVPAGGAFSQSFPLADLSITDPIRSAIGRSIAVHAGPVGSPGAVVAYATIGIADPGPGNSNAATASTTPTSKIVCNLQGSSGASVSGQVLVSIKPTYTLVQALAQGLPTGLHGLHLHTWGDLRNISGKSPGPHYNPSGNPHGIPCDPRRSVGDFGNVQANAGAGSLDARFVHPGLRSLPSLIGRACEVHKFEDHGDTFSAIGPMVASGVYAHANVGAVLNTAAALTRVDCTARQIKKAVAVFAGVLDANIKGTISFLELDNGDVAVTSTVQGLPPTAQFGLHIHEYGDGRARQGAKNVIGEHYNPDKLPHGLPPGPRHVGDMGNVGSDAAGDGFYAETLGQSKLSVTDGIRSIIGRAVTLHSSRDDGGQPTGNAGFVIAWGVVGIANVGSGYTNLAVAGRNIPAAVAMLAGAGGVAGELQFTVTDAAGKQLVTQPGDVPVGRLEGTITGLTPGAHALHLDTYGDFTAAGRTGAHFNPANVTNGLPCAPRAVGDLGNVVADDSGVAAFVLEYPQLLDLRSLLGRSIAVDSGRDLGQGAGTSGTAVASGSIGVANTNYPFTAVTGGTSRQCALSSAVVDVPPDAAPFVGSAGFYVLTIVLPILILIAAIGAFFYCRAKGSGAAAGAPESMELSPTHTQAGPPPPVPANMRDSNLPSFQRGSLRLSGTGVPVPPPPASRV